MLNYRSVSQLSGQMKTPGDNGSSYVQGQYVENQKQREYFYFLDHHGQVFLRSNIILKCLTFGFLAFFGRHQNQEFYIVLQRYVCQCIFLNNHNIFFVVLEKKFLEFFFKKLRNNESSRYDKNFPFVSNCGLERNYLRCDDLPFVVSFLDEKNDLIQLNQINSSHWLFKFDPENLFHNPNNGRLYYLLEDKEIFKQEKLCSNDPRRLKHLDNLPCRIALVKSEISIRLMERVHSEDDNKSLKFEYKSKVYNLNNDQASKASKLITKFSRFEEQN